MTRKPDEKMDTRIVEGDTIKYKVTRKKSNEWIRNTIAFVVALAIVGLCLHLKSFRSARISNNHERNLKYKNQTVDDSVLKKFKKSQLHHRRNQFLGDALWTMEPTFLDNQNSQSQKNDENINTLIDKLDKHNNLNEKNNKGKTTPTHTDKPTTPVTTSSDTTPVVTDKPTTPITTVSVTTPIVTEPGGDPFITTEAPPAQDDDPNETMKLIRLRRQVVGATVTTPDPDSTTTDAPNECAEGSYRGNSGVCQCPSGQGGANCQSAMNAQEAAQQSANTITLTASAFGNISSMNRADFQEEFERLLPDADLDLDRVFVHFQFNNDTNTTTVTFSVILNNPADPDNINAVSGAVTNVVANISSLNVEDQPVHFAAAQLVVEAGQSGETATVPLGATASMGICYIFDEVSACGPASQGRCIGEKGKPKCLCNRQFLGPYCNETMRWSPASQEDETMDILLPVIGAVAGALMLCSCCFFIILRRKSKGVPDLAETESVSTSYPVFPKSSSIILPRFHTKSFWKEMVPGSQMEEVFEVYTSMEAEEAESVSEDRVYREEPVVMQSVIEEVIETESVSSETLSSYPGTSSYIEEYEPLPAGSVQSDYSILPRLRPDNF
ncbi:hypothetical protein ACF0H5_012367 [Mactra antiquata]